MLSTQVEKKNILLEYQLWSIFLRLPELFGVSINISCPTLILSVIWAPRQVSSCAVFVGENNCSCDVFSWWEHVIEAAGVGVAVCRCTVQIMFYIFIDFRVCDFAIAFETPNAPCVSRFKCIWIFRQTSTCVLNASMTFVSLVNALHRTLLLNQVSK